MSFCSSSKKKILHSIVAATFVVTAFLGASASAVAADSTATKNAFVLDNPTPAEQMRWSSVTSAIVASRGLRVFWWNIANGGSEGDVRTLSSNLELLVRSKIKPDVIALGEYSAKALPKATLDLLVATYEARQFIAYNKLTSTGIAVFSRLPLKTVRAATLRWVPSALSPDAAEAYREYWAKGHGDGGDGFYVRPLREIQVVYEGKAIGLTPIHLAQPWRQLSKQTDGKVDFALKTMSELYFRTSNPLITQLSVLTNWLKSGMTPEKLVLGDFNLPRSFAGIPTLGFRRLERVLDSAIPHVENSFPTPSSPHSYPPMQIDHAFIAGELQSVAAGVLPLKGSDHYSVYVVVR